MPRRAAAGGHFERGQVMTEENPSGRPNKFRGKRGPERSDRRKILEAPFRNPSLRWQSYFLNNTINR